MTTPDWISNTPSTDAIHNEPAKPALTPPFTPAQLEQIAQQFIEGFLAKVVQAIVGVFIPGNNGAAFAQLQSWANGIEGLLVGVPDEIAAAVEGFATGLVQQVIDALASVVTGGSTTGNDPLSMLVGFLGQAEKLPANLLALLTAHKATQASHQAQIDAALTGGFVHDFAKGVTGWTNLVGTLAKSSRGAFVQPATETVAYHSSGLAVDAYGVHMDVNPTMQGLCWVGLCATTSGSNWAGLMMYRGFDGDALWLVTGASPTLWAVQKSVSFTGDNRLSGITALKLKTDGVSAFSVVCNGDPVPELDWTDGGGIVTHGSSNRGIILGVNGFDRSDDGSWGPAPMKVASYAA